MIWDLNYLIIAGLTNFKVDMIDHMSKEHQASAIQPVLYKEFQSQEEFLYWLLPERWMC